ncbi:stomatin family protein [Yasminevirus sp. GU-2018]|uniref:Stomatin family protein n=1 Tax=Yasminevirus sp. GU-2018 TaxID=2420051 RepID=A0A5K0U9C4_9VIRU|nr:stomatin family protein [Yasminevirus sp. GU-2018]
MATFVKTATTGIVTTFGKYTKTVGPGLKLYVPGAQVVHHVSNRTQQEGFNLRVLTQDKVFANLSLAIQYRIKEEDTAKAFFSLNNPIAQMSSYVENSIRSHAPKTPLSKLFESFDEISLKVTNDLKDKMSGHGFTIENILMTGIEPDKEVTDAINSISASERRKEAAKNEAEANYVKLVKEAEADRDRRVLHGQGIAGQRAAILEGYKTSVAEMTRTTGMTPKDIFAFILQTQKLDTQETIGKSENAKILFMNSDSKANNNLVDDLISSMEASNYQRTSDHHQDEYFGDRQNHHNDDDLSYRR